MILCAGESLIDMLPAKTEDGNDAMRPVAGGAVMNTAVALGRLDVPVSFVSGVSSDMFGRVIVDHIEDSKVGTDSLIISDRPTTLALVDIQDGVVSYNFYDENTAGRMIAEADLPAIPADTKALFFGGISLISEPAADSYAALLAKGEGDCIVMMDPNIRPAFIKDVDTYKARLTKMLSQTDVVKTSDEDLEWLFPEAASIEDAIKQLQAMGPKMVLFTEGAKGATVYRDGQEPVFVPSVRTEVVDTVGAGDTFNGGFLAALHKNGLLEKSSVLAMTEQQIQTVVSFAAKCAAISVSRAGAQPPWVHEVS